MSDLTWDDLASGKTPQVEARDPFGGVKAPTWEELGAMTPQKEGFFAGMGAKPVYERLPVVGAAAEVYDTYGLLDAANAMREGTQTPEQEQEIFDFLMDGARGQSIGYMAGNLLADTPAFLAEFGLTGGGAALGRKAMAKVVGEAVETAAEKTLASTSKLAMRKMLGEVGAAVGQAAHPVMAPRAFASILRDQMDAQELGLGVDEAGRVGLMLNERAPEFLDSVGPGLARHFGEVFSERAGNLPPLSWLSSLEGAVLGRLAKSAGKKLPWAANRIEQVGWNGFLAEMGEERVSEAIDAALTDTTWEEALPTREQLAAEAISFGLMSGGMNAASFALAEPVDMTGDAPRLTGDAPADAINGEQVDPELAPSATKTDAPVSSETDAPAGSFPQRESSGSQEEVDQPEQAPASVLRPLEPGESGYDFVNEQDATDQLLTEESREAGRTARLMFSDESEDVRAREMVEQSGADFALVASEDGAPLDRPAMIRENAGGGYTVFMDARAPREAKRTALLAHELSHMLERTDREAWEEMYRAITTLDREGLAAAELGRRENVRAAGLEAETAEVSRDEGLATYIERMPGFLQAVSDNPRALQDLLDTAESRGAFRRFLDGLLLAMRRIGINIPTSVERAEREFRESLNLSPREQRLTTEQGLQAAEVITGALAGLRQANVQAAEARREAEAQFEAERAEQEAEAAEYTGAAEGESLTTFLRNQGGLRDETGDLAGITGGARQGKPLVRKTGGMSIDDAMVAAEEEGFLAPGQSQTMSQSEFVEMVRDDFAEPTTYRRFALAPPEESEAFKRWFGDSKVVDEQGKPLVVYHGTTHGFSVFDPERANLENHFGRAIYLTDRPADVSENYAGEGPDLTSRLESRAEQIANENDWDYDDSRAQAQARRELVGGGGRAMPVYASMRNPLDLTAGEWWEIEYDAETGEESGELLRFWESLLNATGQFDDVDIGQLQDDVLGNPEARAADVIEAARASEGLAYATDETGALASSEILRRAIEGMGFDGIIMDAGAAFGVGRGAGRPMEGVEGATHYIAFRPNQIKSATGNRGTFDPASPDIRFALADERFDGMGDPSDSTMEQLKRKVADYFLPLRRKQEQIEELGGEIPEEADVRLAETVFYGSAQERIEKIGREYVEPMAAEMSAGEISEDQASDYLYARGAPKTNEVMAERNPEEFGREYTPGSGMRTSEAQRIVREAESGPSGAHYKKLGELFDAMNTDKLNHAVESGTISAETRDAWQETYGPHWTPLKTNDDGSRQIPTLGRGFEIKGKESERRMGRKSKADNVLLNAIVDAQKFTVRGEKNRVGQALKNLIDEFPDATSWSVRSTGRETPIEEKEPGQQALFPDANWEAPTENEVGVKVNGEQFVMSFRDERIPAAMKKLGVDAGGKFVQVFGAVTRLLSAMSTSWNPEFTLSNLARDVQTAKFNLSSDGQADIAKKVNVRTIGGAIRGIANELRGREGGEWGEWYRRMSENGGTTGWTHVRSIEQQGEELAELLKKADGDQSVRAAFGALRDFVEDYNSAIENGVRLAAFKAAVEGGMSERRAAALAKELTVNFNRKGEWGSIINAFYMFFNAGLQGTLRTLNALRTPRGKKLAAGLAAVGFASDILARLMAGEDEDGFNRYDKLPEWVKSRNWILMLPDGNALKIPMPYGWSMFHSIGRNVAAAMPESMLGGETKAGDAALNITEAAWDSFAPIGSESSWLQKVSPTLTDPFVQLSENETFYGGAIRPQRFPGQLTSDAYLHWQSVNPAAESVAKGLNRLTGGDSVRSGWIDVNPHDIEHMVEFLTGGLGRTISRGSLVLEPDTPLGKLPFIRTFYMDEPEWFTGRKYAEYRKEVQTVKKQVAEAREAKDKDRVRLLQKEYGPVLRLEAALKRAEKRIKIATTEEARDKAQSSFVRQYRQAVLGNGVR